MTFLGTFEKIGYRNGYAGPEKRVVLKNLRDKNGRILMDKITIAYTKGFEDLGVVSPGSTIIFEARVKEKIKGGCSLDSERPVYWYFILANPTKISIMSEDNIECKAKRA
jgi:hypothetical protein